MRNNFTYDEHTEVMGIEGFGRKFRDNPTPDTDVAALHYEKLIAESNLPMADTDTPCEMDN
eukprot:1505272-Ditylum_brightwellii.AAC.1